MELKNFIKLAEGINFSEALNQINDTMWHSDTYLRDYPQGPFGETDSIICRFPPISVKETEKELRKHITTFDQHECEWKSIIKDLPAVENLVFFLMSQVRGTRLGRVIINRVKAGGEIYPHEDTPAHARYWSRFHIVLKAKSGVDFTCGDEQIQMLTGEIWYFRNDLMHSVVNNSDEDRIHLVVDIKTPLEKPVAEGATFNHENGLPTKSKAVYNEGFSYQVEQLHDVIEELKPFAPLHWSELGLTKDNVPLDMDWERYLDLEDNDKLHLVTVRHNGHVIGYQFTFVGGHFHYKSTKHGLVDLYYLLPQFRKGKVGVELFKFAEAELKKIGVVKIITGCKAKLPGLDHTKLFEHLGYELSDYQFIKIIN
jgi:GNAT superfamily N-acetyltransferase